MFGDYPAFIVCLHLLDSADPLESLLSEMRKVSYANAARTFAGVDPLECLLTEMRKVFDANAARTFTPRSVSRRKVGRLLPCITDLLLSQGASLAFPWTRLVFFSDHVPW